MSQFAAICVCLATTLLYKFRLETYVQIQARKEIKNVQGFQVLGLRSKFLEVRKSWTWKLISIPSYRNPEIIQLQIQKFA